MAVIVDVLGEARRRFTEWAEEFVGVPREYLTAGTVRGECVDEVARFLIENKVFTKAEIELIAARRGFSGAVALYNVREG